jgi:hypothetical protein
MPAAADCERIRPEQLLGQPVNALTSLAFVVVGLALMRRRPLIGVLTAGVGLGSFAFHGPMPPWSEWLHDLTLITLILGVGLEHRPRVWLALAVASALLFAAAPGAADPLTAAASVVVVLPWVRRAFLPVAVLAGGALVGTLSRTGWPLCDPGTLWQGHGLWHLSAAAAIWLWAWRTSASHRRLGGLLSPG